MARSAWLLLALLLGGTLASSRGHAQTADGPTAAPEPEFLKTFPRPPAQPGSL